MRASQSKFFNVRGLRYHLRHWPGSQKPLRLIVHGWSDTSGTWQRLVDHLPTDWEIAAPDMRGFGLSERGGDTYIFADYLADLDTLLRQLPEQQIDLIGHSMGGQVAALYAGLRPERIRKLVILDAMYLPNMPPEDAPMRLRQWLDDIHTPVQDRYYDNLDELAQRTAKNHIGLDADGAAQVAAAWGGREEDGRVRLLADPRHRQRGPLLYRDAEARAVFRQIEAPTLLLDAENTNLKAICPQEEREARIACFKNAQRLTLENSGHMLHFDAPKRTAAVVQDFLGK